MTPPPLRAHDSLRRGVAVTETVVAAFGPGTRRPTGFTHACESTNRSAMAAKPSFAI